MARAKNTSPAVPGVNIQFPISRLICAGKKDIETRTYPLPIQYLNTPVALIETPGLTGNFKARAVAMIWFIKCYPYNSKADFYFDIDRHFVSPESPWAWDSTKPKWAWVIGRIEKLKAPIEISKRRGIVFTKNTGISI